MRERRRKVQDSDGGRVSEGGGAEDWHGESDIIVFGGGGRRGCSGTGCLFWVLISVVLNVGLTILVNLISLLLLSGPAPGIPGVDL